MGSFTWSREAFPGEGHLPTVGDPRPRERCCARRSGPAGLPREGCVAIARRSMGDDVTVVDGDPLVVHLEPQPVATVRVRPEWGGGAGGGGREAWRSPC
ncbi:MAG: hypothetical protein IPG97_15650 [Microthrixaceae bacterium]|nr:hypothetical protein [Microthrixaceae bacterium]